jgi:hypothetical protein
MVPDDVGLDAIPNAVGWDDEEWMDVMESSCCDLDGLGWKTVISVKNLVAKCFRLACG